MCLQPSPFILLSLLPFIHLLYPFLLFLLSFIHLLHNFFLQLLQLFFLIYNFYTLPSSLRLALVQFRSVVGFCLSFQRHFVYIYIIPSSSSQLHSSTSSIYLTSGLPWASFCPVNGTLFYYSPLHYRRHLLLHILRQAFIQGMFVVSWVSSVLSTVLCLSSSAAPPSPSPAHSFMLLLILSHPPSSLPPSHLPSPPGPSDLHLLPPPSGPPLRLLHKALLRLLSVLFF